MRAVLQRVVRAHVSVDGKVVGAIDRGLCVFLGVGVGDSERDAEFLADKIVNLRIFEDESGKLNLSLLDTHKCALIVSQFTLYGDSRKGRRPSFIAAATPEEGNHLYEYFVEQVKLRGVKTACGVFRTHMVVDIANDGPVTLILDTSDFGALNKES